MAEQIVSPGVFTRENDQSFITQQPVTVGAAILGPTVKGPVEAPTVVTSYSEFKNKFGSYFVSNSQTYSFLTSISAYNYFQNGGESLLVTRVQSGSWTEASSSQVSNNATVTGGAEATGSETISAVFADGTEARITDGTKVYRFIASGNPIPQDDVDGDLYFFSTGSTATLTATNLAAEINKALSGSLASASVDLVVASTDTTTLILSASAVGTPSNGITLATGSAADFSTQITLEGGVNGTGNSNSFTLKTISEGIIQNSESTVAADGSLPSGSADNVRWEITSADSSSGVFTLNIRRGDDLTNEKTILETFANISLDPEQDNYITKAIGDYRRVIATDGTVSYLKVEGEYPNVSKYVYVAEVKTPTAGFFDNSGNAKAELKTSIPIVQSGVFGGATGTILTGEGNYFDNITSADSQGLVGGNYDTAISLLNNKDEYQYNVITAPGLIHSLANHTSTLNTLITNTQNRGDAIAVVDIEDYGATVSAAVTAAQNLNSSYAAAYWPWVQIQNPDTGKLNFVPASTLIPGVYAFNDANAEPWFAPAGINRGGLDTVIRPERKLTKSNRDTLYEANVNPIASFPANGTVVFGQKTLQKKASALDRVNVRRLLIALKSFIGQTANNLVFEQNSAATRNSFLASVNPYLESVQQRQGVYAFKVVMDDTNNTPDVVDRNQLVGQIFLQPTRTAEFIILDFNVLPTGAEFSS